MTAPDPALRLREGLEKLLDPERAAETEAPLLTYLALLRRWNETYNLTAVRDVPDMVTRHLLDSLSVLPWTGEGRMLDAGTGGGLPGIPLAIARPDLELTLLDSAGKKVRFLNHVRRVMRLTNVSPVQARLESFEAGQRFDGIISRAFSDLARFAQAARHLVGPESRILAMKGRYPAQELEALPEWIEVVSVEELAVPGLQEKRHLVIMSVNA